MSTFQRILLTLLMIGIAFSLAYTYYLAFWPREVLHFNQDIALTQHDTYTAGEQLFVNLNFCVIGDYSATVYPEMVGDSIVPLSPYTSQIAPGCYNSSVAVGFIPTYVPAGDYKVRLILRYRVNSFKVATYTIETSQFHVKPGHIGYY